MENSEEAQDIRIERLEELTRRAERGGATGAELSELEFLARQIIVEVDREDDRQAARDEPYRKAIGSTEWVALTSFANEDDNERPFMPHLIEEGGVYPREARETRVGGPRFRPCLPDEPTVACARCGRRFVATEGSTAAQNRDLHMNGDEDIPSICLHVKAQLRLVE
jgi:hypothetical protein